MAVGTPLVHLIYPRIGGRGLHETNGFNYRPYALFVLAALARRSGWRVRVIDENRPGPEPPPTEHPDLVAITAWTRFAPRAYEIAVAYRARGIPSVIGGVHPSVAVSEALRYADAVVAGEAEGIFATVLDDALSGTLRKVYRGAWGDMADVPHVAEFADLVSAKPFHRSPLHSYQSTRGCRFNCDFCSVIRINGRGARHIDPGRVVEELTIITKLRPRLPGNTSLYLLDDDIAADPDYLVTFCEALIAADLPLTWGAQASIGIARNPELLDLAVRAGMDGVFIGFESMSRESLLEANKKNRPKEYGELVKRLHDHGVTVRGGLVLGFDNDGPEVFTQTAEAAHACGIDVAHFTILTPLPGTGLFARLYDEGRITNYNWADYDVYHPVFEPARMTNQQLGEGLITAYRTFYGRTRRLQRFAWALRHQRLRQAAASTMNNAMFARAYDAPLELSTLDFQANPDDVAQIAAASRADANAAIDVAVEQAGGAAVTSTPVTLLERGAVATGVGRTEPA